MSDIFVGGQPQRCPRHNVVTCLECTSTTVNAGPQAPAVTTHTFVVPGDAWVDPLIKRGETLERIPEDERTSDQQRELDVIKEAARLRDRLRELPDDPTTWFTDESRRPQLNGIDWNDANHKLACDEVWNFAKMLAARFGVPLAEAALQAGIAAIRR